jgi:hypothetical protein
MHEAIGASRRYRVKPQTVFGMHHAEAAYHALLYFVRTWVSAPLESDLRLGGSSIATSVGNSG